MPKDPFMLVSLREDKAKKVAQVLSSPTATKILNYLTENEATESQISKALKIPLSTVHYNIQQLVDAKLVIVEEFHYSDKGREVNHYKLANKYIIIAPKEDEGLLQHLKKFIPITTITLGLAVVLKVMQFATAPGEVADDSMQRMAAPMAQEMTMVASDAVMKAEPVLPWWQSPFVDYFILGAVFVLVVLVVSELVSYWRWKKK